MFHFKIYVEIICKKLYVIYQCVLKKRQPTCNKLVILLENRKSSQQVNVGVKNAPRIISTELLVMERISKLFKRKSYIQFLKYILPSTAKIAQSCRHPRSAIFLVKQTQITAHPIYYRLKIVNFLPKHSVEIIHQQYVDCICVGVDTYITLCEINCLMQTGPKSPIYL